VIYRHVLIYVKVDESLKTSVDALINDGRYSDFNSATVTALQNLVLAEREFDKGDSVIQSLPQGRGADFISGLVGPDVRFDSSSFPSKLIGTPPADIFEVDQAVPIERWIFGQQNRILPVKVNARVFANLVAANEHELDLDAVAADVARVAADVHAYLHRIDVRRGHKKDELLATAFPEPGSEKAASRYANHFVAYESTRGTLSGMLVQWKFASVRRTKGRTRLLPTRECIEFAGLKNPLLDSLTGAESNRAKLSPEEIRWALTHIGKNVPVETSAYSALLRGIVSGASAPESLDRFIRETTEVKKETTDEFVGTQRAGAISRMADLDLVRRVRSGTRVTYESTALGSEFLAGKFRPNP
jgi:hypothetical protein